jgi:hypothetical protein
VLDMCVWLLFFIFVNRSCYPFFIFCWMQVPAWLALLSLQFAV